MLEIRDLHLSYGNNGILNGIDLALEAGESLAIIGESGAGKTTLGLSIMRLAEASIRGSILFEGKEIPAMSETDIDRLRWSRIAMVFQNVSSVLNPLHTVIDQVAEPMTAHNLYDGKEARQRAGELLRKFGLPPFRHEAYPHQVSGGEQQRVLLAMAFSNEPDLLIMDEPLSSLDATAREELAQLLRKEQGSQARLVITHDLDTARRLSDNLAVLYGGRILEYGPTDRVLSEPHHPYTRALIRAYPNMTTVKDLQGIKGRMSRNVSGCPFHPRCSQAKETCKDRVPELTGDKERKVACHRGGIVTLLSVRGLTVSLDGFRAVNGADIDIKSGETVALVGQSGSGKTTLARAVMGLVTPKSGLVLLEGETSQGLGKKFYSRVQMVFQDPGESLSHRLSVLELVMEPLDVQKTGNREERREKAAKTIGEVRLPQTEEFLGTYPHHLSGGELQRVAIARALVNSPDLLIADEPTSFLDASVGASILKLLLELQEQRGLSLLFITHDIAAARKVSDRIAVMKEGRIIETGPAGLVTYRPREDYTKSLIDAAARLNDRD